MEHTGGNGKGGTIMTDEKRALLGDHEAAKRLTDAGVLLMQGDCLELLKDIPDDTGRKFIGMELDPGYFEVAKRRIEEAQAQVRLDWNTRAPILTQEQMDMLEEKEAHQ